MQPIWGNVAALSVALIFYTWRMFAEVRMHKQRVLCERVAYMLWAVAEHSDAAHETVPADAF